MPNNFKEVFARDGGRIYVNIMILCISAHEPISELLQCNFALQANPFTKDFTKFLLTKDFTNYLLLSLAKMAVEADWFNSSSIPVQG